jgi:hypothetical protein
MIYWSIYHLLQKNQRLKKGQVWHTRLALLRIDFILRT